MPSEEGWGGGRGPGGSKAAAPHPRAHHRGRAVAAAAAAGYALAGPVAVALVAMVSGVAGLILLRFLVPPRPAGPAGEDLSGPDPAVPPPVLSTFTGTWRRQSGLVDAQASRPAYDAGLRPPLQHLLAARLAERHGISLHDDPDAARRLLCPGGRPRRRPVVLGRPGPRRPRDRAGDRPGIPPARWPASSTDWSGCDRVAPCTPGQTAERCAAVLDEIERAVVGHRRALELVMIGILAGGHILLEDLPGLGKTLIARSFARVLGLDFARIQFTPDLLPSDVVGAPLYDQRTGEMVFRPGPVFTQLLLADEINRTPPKTQAALLEAMGEGQVSMDGETRPLPQPFVVLATDNPIEYEGTYELPEAQLDRFLMRLRLGYLAAADEVADAAAPAGPGRGPAELGQVTDAAELIAMRRSLEQVEVSARPARVRGRDRPGDPGAPADPGRAPARAAGWRWSSWPGARPCCASATT